MATETQREAARRNVKTAPAAWQMISHTERARAQPQGRGREKPGASGEGESYRIVARPKEEFVTLRTQDGGGPGHIEQLAGQCQSGSWDTQAWLVGEQDARVEGGRLIPDTAAARDQFSKLGSDPGPVAGDVFEAKARPTVPESATPTAARRRAAGREHQEGPGPAVTARQGQPTVALSGIQPGWIMQLTLSDEDARTLRQILHDYLPDLRREAAGTDLAARELRHELAVRERLCERLLAELERSDGR